MPDSPYQFRPEDEVTRADADQGESPVSSKPLHSLWSVFFATLFGSILGGGVVISINLFRLNRTRQAWIAVVVTVVSSFVLFAGLLLLPDDLDIPSSAFYVPVLISMHLLAKHIFGDDLEKQKRAGGLIRSGWGGVGVGFVCMVALLLVIVGASILVEGVPINALFADFGSELVVGNDSVYYDGDATKNDAKLLADFLKEWEYFCDEGTDARIRYEGGECIVSFCLYESAVSDDEIVSVFQSIANDLAGSGFGPPTKVELCNDMFEPLVTLTGVAEDFYD